MSTSIRTPHRLLTYGFLLAAIFTMINTANAANVFKQCETFWNKMASPEENLTLEQRLARWEAKKSECGSEGIYEYGAARLYLLMRKYDAARQLVADIGTKNVLLHKELKMVLADADFYEAAFKEPLATAQLNKAKAQYKALITDYPDWYGGHQGMGTITLGLNDYEKSIKYSMDAVSKKETSTAYRNLAVALMAVKRYDEVIPAATRAYQLDTNRLSDRDMIFSAAVAFARLENYEDSKELVESLVSKRPELKDDAGIIALYQFLATKTTE